MTKIYTLRAYCLFLLCFACFLSSRADIVTGGEITYHYLGHDSVELTATLYHGCQGIALSSIQIGIKPSCSSTFYVTLTNSTTQDVTPVCKYGCSACTPGGCKTNAFGFNKYIFRAVVDLSSYKNCCDFTFFCYAPDQRSYTATGGDGEYRYIESHMNRCLTGYHSSPVFDYDPVIMACENTCVSRLQSATDYNGDSLSYSLVTPLQSPGTSITYNAGYSATSPMDVATTGTCSGFYLDAVTGQLSFKGIKPNYYAMAFRVDIWHKDSSGKYVKTGNLLRDADLFVQDCSSDTSYPKSTLPSSISSSLSGINGVSGAVSASVCAGTALSFYVGGLSGNVIDSIRVLPRDSVLLKYLTYAVSGKGNKTVRVNFSINPPAKMARRSAYFFDLVLKTQRCPRPDYINKRYYIYVKDSLPDLKIIKSDSGCGHYYISSSADTALHLTYNWKINGAFVSGNHGFSYHFWQNRKYIIQLAASNTGGCTKIFTDTLIFKDVPKLIVSGDTTICQGDSVKISAIGATKYQWRSANGKFYSDKASPYARSGIYYATGIDSNGCAAVDTVVVNMYGSELKWNSDVYACEGDSININVKNADKYFFTWRIPMWQNPIPDTTAWVHTRHPSPQYDFYAYNRQTGCYVHGTILIHINYLTAGEDVSVCSGDSVQLHASGGTKYQWLPDKDISNLNIPNPFVHPTSDHNYIVQISDSLGCMKQDTVRVKVSDIYLKVSSSVGICKGGMTVLSATANGAVNYHWTPATGLDFPDSRNPTAQPSATTMYHVSVCDSLCGCVKDDSVLVMVTTVNADAGQDRRICHGDSVILGSPARKGYHYEWTSTGSHFRIDTPQLKVSPEVNTVYTLLVTDSVTGCYDTDMINIKVNPLKPLKMTIGNVIACRRFETFFEVNADTGYTYHWVVTGAKIYDGLDTNRITLQWIGLAISLKVVRTSSEGCIDSLRIPVVLFNDPHADFMAFTSCAGMKYNFLDSSLRNTAHRWDFGDGQADFSSGGTIAHVYTKPGWYRVRETASNVHGCFDTISKLVQVLPAADAHWHAISLENGKVSFSAIDTSGLVYEWKFGDSTIFSGYNTIHTYSKGGAYLVRLTITDSFGCIASKDSIIVASESSKPDIGGSDSLTISPNPFSENIRVRYYLKENSSSIMVIIYDMLGQEVYASASNDIPAGSYDQSISTAAHEFGLGMYVVKVIINDRTTIRKMLKVNY